MQTRSFMPENGFQNHCLNEACNNPNLHVIAFTTDCILARNVKTNKVHFIYTTSPDNLDNGMIFDFSLLSECNDNASGQFTQILTDLKMHLQTVETDTDYYQIVVNDNHTPIEIIN